jgi:CubicO group peptidase (beta-lactamase class C family)
LFACTASDEKDTSTPATVEPLQLQSTLNQVVNKNNGYGGGVLRASTEAGIRFEGVAGESKAGGGPISADSTFEIASITKTFTATLTLQLVEEGAFSLEDGLGDVLPEWSSGLLVIGGRDRTSEITVRQLLNHSSGLPDYWSDPPFVQPQTNAFLRAFLADTEHFWTPEEILSYVPGLDPIGAPGESWHYSDTNYVLLGLIIEKQTEKALHKVMAEKIFEPLSMENTWMSFREDRGFPDAHRYEAEWDMSVVTHQSADWAGGGLISTAADLSSFLLGLAGGELFENASTLKEMKEGIATDYKDIRYGLGLFLVDLDDGSMLWGHDGYGNSFLYLHDADATVFAGGINQTENDWWPLAEEGL